MGTDRNNYRDYDYTELSVKNAQLSLQLDGLESFGWEVVREEAAPQPPRPDGGEGHAASAARERGTKRGRAQGGAPAAAQVVRLRRDRHIYNKVELTRLQRHFAASLQDIARMEQAKENKAIMAAIGMGLSGCAFMAGAVFAVLAAPPILWLTTLLAIPGVACWILPFWVKERVAAYESARLQPLIEAKYDELAALMARGRRLCRD